MIGSNSFTGKRFHFIGAAAIAVALAAGSTGAFAQAAKKDAPPAKAADQQPAAAAAANQSAWVKLCEKAPVIAPGKDGKEEQVLKSICLTHHERLDGNTGMVLVSAAVREVEGQDKKHLMVMVPLGMAIQPGLRAKIFDQALWDVAQKNEKVDDSKLTPVKLSFSLCHPAGCTAEIEITNEFMEQLKVGAGIMIYAINANGQVIAFPVPMNGFTTALGGPPIDNVKYSEARKGLMQQIALRQQALIEEYKKKQADQGKPGAPADPKAAAAAPKK